MATADEVRRASQLRRQMMNQSPDGQPTAEQVRAASRMRNRETLSLNQPAAERALSFGTETGGSPAPDERTWGERIRQGAAAIAEPWVESAKGIHELMGGTPEELAIYDQTAGELERQVEGMPGRTAANLAGEALQFAAPGGAGAKLASKGLQGVRALRGAAPVVGEAVGIGAFEAAATPGSAEDRTRAGATAAAGAAVGGTLGRGLAQAAGRVVQPVKPTPQGQQLLDAGYSLTPKQATEPGSMIGRAEDFLSHVPGWRGIERLRDVPIGQFQDDIWAGISPAAKGLRGTEAARAAQKQLGSAYDDVFETMTRVPTQNVTALRSSLMREGGPVNQMVASFDDTTQQALTRFIDARFQNLQRRNTPNTWQSTLASLRDRATKYRNDGLVDEAEIMERVQDSLTKMLPKGTQSKLTDLNRRYRDLAVVQKAMTYQPSLEAGGQFSPVELLKASRAMGTPRQTAGGTATMQTEALDTLNLSPPVATRRQLIGQPDLVPTATMAGLGFMTGGPAGVATVGAAGIPLATDPVRRALLGQTGLQQMLTPPESVQRMMADALRRYSARGGAGGALTFDDIGE